MEPPANKLVARLRIVVRPVIRMAPFVVSLGDRFDDPSRTDDRDALRPEHSQQFVLVDAASSQRADKDLIGDVACKVNTLQRPLMGTEAASQDACHRRRFADLRHFVAAG